MPTRRKLWIKGGRTVLTNASNYNREHDAVEVMCIASSPGRLRIRVKDSGAGLSVEKLTHLFEPFNRLGQEAGTEEGTGVGSEFWIELMRERSHEQS